jgi:hypothetical protein
MRRLSILAALVALAAGAIVAVGALASGETQSQPSDTDATASSIPLVTADVTAVRLATARYAANLNRAKADDTGSSQR